eukprot:TRINITY_DN790_c0_g2_i1.p1 TRINITY_DN790_c0_g2~~TRINITY_DN790_c0_g2_i1.p1  ORF type:complete len:347 (+),score=80.85 TRINITY_DN790_c0_g2_i1:51-1091(+)
MDYGAPAGVDPGIPQQPIDTTAPPVDSWNGQAAAPVQDGYGVQQQGMPIPPPQSAGGGQKVGTVKKWDDSRGYGFIQTEDGTDMFYLAKQNAGQTLIQGGQVCYDVEFQENGKPWAVNVSGMGVGPPQIRAERQWGDDAFGYGGKGKGKKGKDGKKGGKKGGKDGKGKGFGKDGFKGFGKEGKKGKKSGIKGPEFGMIPQSSQAPFPMPGSSGTGIVKKWYTDKGYGFISTGEGSKDLFVHHKGINGVCMEGQEVNYTVETQANGQPWAVNLSGVGFVPSGVAAPPATGMAAPAQGGYQTQSYGGGYSSYAAPEPSYGYSNMVPQQQPMQAHPDPVEQYSSYYSPY